MATLIPLVGKYGKNKYAIIDDNMAYLKKYTWRVTPAGYVYRAVWSKERQNNLSTYLHREIMNCPKNFMVDHLNGNILDNRKNNLKIVTMRENLLNRHCHDCGRLPEGLSRAYSIKVDGKTQYFNTINEAIIAKEKLWA